jgi:hypothetical protein
LVCTAVTAADGAPWVLHAAERHPLARPARRAGTAAAHALRVCECVAAAVRECVAAAVRVGDSTPALPLCVAVRVCVTVLVCVAVLEWLAVAERERVRVWVPVCVREWLAVALLLRVGVCLQLRWAMEAMGRGGGGGQV